jgi:hypothetical protein
MFRHFLFYSNYYYCVYTRSVTAAPNSSVVAVVLKLSTASPRNGLLTVRSFLAHHCEFVFSADCRVCCERRMRTPAWNEVWVAVWLCA